MLNGRIYRASFIPLLVALVVAGFSLSAPSGSLSSTLAPDAFNGQAAFAELGRLARSFPDRAPGSAGDAALASAIAHTLEGLGNSGAGGFTVLTRQVSAATIAGRRTLSTVIARRPGLGGGSAIVLLAHRDASGRGSLAQLSGTAVLLELARVLATSETRRPIVIVSTSGGSGGEAGASDFASRPGGPVDAAIALGDLAGATTRKPFVLPYSWGLGLAPELLTRTLAGAVGQELGVDPGGSDTLSRLAHLALPLTVTEAGPLLAAGIPAATLQVSGELGPARADPVSAQRLENLGRAVLSTVYALDGGPDVPSAAQAGLPIQHKILPLWAMRLLLLALLLPPLFTLVDGLARLRRHHRGGDGAARLAPYFLWTLACAAPFLLAGLFTRLLGRLGLLIAPGGLVLAAALPRGAVAVESVLAPLFVLALAWLCWPAVTRRLGLPGLHPAQEAAAGLALLLVLSGATLVVWLHNPYAALLLAPALHLWLPIADPSLRTAGRAPRARSFVLLALALVPLVLVMALYAHQLGYGASSFAQASVLLLAGGYLGIPAILVWCLALGCLCAATLLALRPPAPLPSVAVEGMSEEMPITVRGPLSYAGPGSLGGTESALRR